MEIATGYFAKAKAYADNGYSLVSISRVAPWFLAKTLTLYSCPELAPTDEILALKDRPEEYGNRYRREILAGIDWDYINRWLRSIARQDGTDKIVLLCYEAPNKFCHRHIVAEWLGKHIGHMIHEVDVQGLYTKELDGLSQQGVT